MLWLAEDNHVHRLWRHDMSHSRDFCRTLRDFWITFCNKSFFVFFSECPISIVKKTHPHSPYGKVSDVAESWVQFASKTLTPCTVGCTWFPDSLDWPLMHKFSKYVWHAISASRLFGGANLFSLRLSPQQADEFLLQVAMEICEKWNLFYSSASSSKTQRDIVMGHKSWKGWYT